MVVRKEAREISEAPEKADLKGGQNPAIPNSSVRARRSDADKGLPSNGTGPVYGKSPSNSGA
jgi:hypothetical protein